MMNKKNNGFYYDGSLISRAAGIYAAIAVLIIVGTVGRFVYGIISEADRGNVSAKTTFAYFAKYLISSAENEEFGEAVYKEKAEKLAAELALKGFAIYDSKGKIFLSWSKDSEIIQSDDTGTVSVKTASFFTKNFTGEISLKTKQAAAQTFKLSAAVPTLKGEIIYALARSSFFIIFTVLLLTLIIIFMEKLSQASGKIYATVLPKETEEEDLPDDSSESVKNNLFSSTDNGYTEELKTSSYSAPANNFYKDTEKKDSVKDEYDGKTYTLEDLDNLSITKSFPYESDTKVEEYNEPVDITYLQTAEENSEEGKNDSLNYTSDTTMENLSERPPVLYSPITGIPTQAQLMECLQYELEHSGASEQELAFSIIKLKDFTIESLVAKKIADMLIEVVKLKDMIFEFEDDGFAVIFQDTGLDGAMKKCEEIYGRIKNILDEYNISEPIAIGITARFSRLIDSHRMMEEVRAALARAIDGNNEPIVAFRVNTEKYRKFIAAENI